VKIGKKYYENNVIFYRILTVFLDMMFS